MKSTSEKIKDLTWYDLITKLREILGDLTKEGFNYIFKGSVKIPDLLNKPSNSVLITLSSDGTLATTNKSDFLAGFGSGGIQGVLDATGTLDFPNTLPNTSSDLTITVTGAVLGDVVSLGSPIPPAGCVYSAFVSSSNTITIRLVNTSELAVDPANVQFKIKVLK